MEINAKMTKKEEFDKRLKSKQIYFKDCIITIAIISFLLTNKHKKF